MTRYSITDLEKLSGIKAHTIRMWEKRYNIVKPERTETNIRYYHDYDLKKLLNISILNRHGFKISTIAKMTDHEINDKVMEISGTTSDYATTINNLVIAMLELDEDSFDKILNTSILQLGFEHCVTHILYPFLEKIGMLWLIGTVNPAQEHFITYLIRQKLIIAIDGQPKPSSPDARTFLLFLPEKELHELGLLFYSFLLKKNGFKVIYLGQSVPFNDLIEVVKIRNAEYLLTYFVAAMNPKEIPGYINKLAEAFPDKKTFITGIQLKQAEVAFPKNVTPVDSAENFKRMLKDL